MKRRTASTTQFGYRGALEGSCSNRVVGRFGRSLKLQRIRNRARKRVQKVQGKMSAVKTAFLSFLMLSAIIVCGVGIYTADAATNHAVIDGYGITAVAR